jgi:hypothetical protein
MISGDEKAFLREYEIPANYSFFSFHKFIQDDLGFDSDQLASFFITDEHWNKGLELTLIDMENDAGLAAVPMESVKLSDLLKSKKDRCLYVFDIFSDRCFFIQLADIAEPNEDNEYPYCKVSLGNPPEQLELGDMSINDIFDDDDIDDDDSFDEIINDIDIESLDSDDFPDQDFY